MFPTFRDSGPFLNLLPFPTGGAGIPAPAITVGPVWTDNADGTATVTFTTDIATYGGIDFGTSTGVYTQSAFDYDGAGPALELATSHTVPVPDAMAGGTLPDDTYYYRVWGGTPAGFSGYISAEDTGTIASGPPLTALAAWYKKGTGQSTSAWNDNSGNGQNLTLTNSPTLNGDGSITFNGTDELGQKAFTLNQPCTVYLKFQQETWTTGDRIWDGAAGVLATLRQAGTTPALVVNAGSGDAGSLTGLALNTTGVITVVLNGASSEIRLDSNAGSTINPGTNNPGGITLAGGNSGAGQWSNITAFEMLVYSAAHNTATQNTVLTYLATV